MAEYIERGAIAKLFDSECRGECVVCPHDDRGDCTLMNQIPAADVQPVKHGRWSGSFCSNCGISKYNFISFNFDDQNGYARPFGTWLFCPRCGARMDGET